MANIATIPRLSREYVLVPVTEAGGAVLTALPVALAFTDGAEPAEADWKTATWSGDGARVLVGPGGAVELAAATWSVWIRVTDTTEIPIRQAGLLVVQ